MMIPLHAMVHASFNGSSRDECLDTSWFMSLEDARPLPAGWNSQDMRPARLPLHV
jgi:hypothetical protein